MHWITVSSRSVLDLTADQSLLQSIGTLARWLHEGNRIDGERELSRVLRQAARDERVFGALLRVVATGDPETGLIEDSWRRMLDPLGDRFPEDYALLGCRLADLESGRCGDGRRRLTWAPIRRALAAPVAGLRDLTLNLGASAGQELVAEAGPRVPVVFPQSAHAGLLRIGLRGVAQASVSARIPIRIGNIGAGVEGDSGVEIDYFFSNDEDSLLAEALSTGLAGLTTPYDLFGLGEALAGGNLLGLNLDAWGELGFAGSFGVGESFELARGTEAEIGLNARFEARREGRFRFTIRGAGDSADPRAVLVDIRRTAGRSETEAAALGLRLDLRSAVASLRPRLLKLTGDAQRILDGFDDLLPPSQAVRGLLRDELEVALDRPDLRRLLADATGISPGTDAAELQERLGPLIDADTRIWNGRSRDVARAIAHLAGAGLGLRTGEGGALEAAIVPALTAAVEELQLGFRERLRALADGDAAFERTLERLGTRRRRSGGRPRTVLERMDAIAVPVAAELQKLQEALSRLSGAIAQAAEVKLRARIHREERRSQSDGMRQRLRFHPGREAAQLLFEQLMTGSMDGTFAAMGGQAEDGPVEVLEGAILRASGIDRRTGFELTLLDFSLSGASVLDADVVIESDQAGNIRVFSRTESQRERRGFGEMRTLRTVNVYELATAGITKRMTFAISLSHREERFEDHEVLSFFKGLEQERLLPAGTGAAALDRLEEQTARDRDAKRRGELRVWLELSEEELLRLLQLSGRGNGVGLGPFDTHLVYRTAVATIVSGHELTGSRTVLRNLRHLIRTERMGSNLESVLRKMSDPTFRDRHRPRGGGFGFGDSSAEFGILERMSDRASGLAVALRAMREIYLSSSNESRRRWTENDYLRRQELIDGKVQFWLQGELLDRGLRSFTSEALRPYTLAFFKTIAVLAKERGGTPPLAASLYFDAKPVARDVRLI